MTILSTEEERKVIQYRSEGRDIYEITQRILAERGEAMFQEVRRATVLVIEDPHIRKILKETPI